MVRIWVVVARVGGCMEGSKAKCSMLSPLPLEFLWRWSNDGCSSEGYCEDHDLNERSSVKVLRDQAHAGGGPVSVSISVEDEREHHSYRSPTGCRAPWLHFTLLHPHPKSMK